MLNSFQENLSHHEFYSEDVKVIIVIIVHKSGRYKSLKISASKLCKISKICFDIMCLLLHSLLLKKMAMLKILVT